MTMIAMEPDVRLGVTQPRVVASEWVKFRSLRSTWWSIGLALLIAVGLGILFCDLRGSDISQHGDFEPDQTAVSLRGFYLAQLAVGVLGALSVTGEYSTGMIRATLSAVPKRVPVWVAKIVVFATVIFVVSLIAAFGAFLGGQAVLHSYHVNSNAFQFFPGGTAASHVIRLGVSLGHPGSLRAVFGAALYMAGIGLLGLGCGFAIRNTGGAIAGLFGLVLVLPLLAEALPSSLQNHVTKFLPLPAGTAVMDTVRGTNELGPWAGIGVLGIYVAVALLVGLVVLRRRDA
jgi:ABC-type transport system involved in multi-copper enzyme maturation permease subunit